MPSSTLLLLSRWQFAFTVAFHMLFPAVTVGLAIFLVLVYGLYLRTGDRVYLQIFRFWKKILAVGSRWVWSLDRDHVRVRAELGAVCRSDWPDHRHGSGHGVFVEAGFIGIMLYGVTSAW